MKRLIALLLVLVMSCLCLVSCADDLKSLLEKHKDEVNYQPPVVDDVTLDMYIISDAFDSNDTSAYDDVKRQINLYTQKNYHTTLNITFTSSANHEQIVNENLATADIILVTSREMMDALVEDDKVVDLSTFFAQEAYGALNVDIAEALLNASMYDGKLFAVPNNRVLGSYTYVCMRTQSLHNGHKIPLVTPSDYPYVFSLDQCNDEVTMTRLIRSILAKDIVAAKDADAMQSLGKSLFKTLVIDAIAAQYGNSYKPDENINRANRLLGLLSEEDVAAIQATLEEPISTLLTPHPELTPENNGQEYVEYYDRVTGTLMALYEYYLTKEYNYDYKDAPVEGAKPLPAVEDLIAWYMCDYEEAADCATLLANGLFTLGELETIMDASSYDGYAALTRDPSFNIDSYTDKDVILLDGAMYEDKAALEAKGWVVNVLSYPLVDKDMALESAFAIVKQDDVAAERVMDIIYAFNKDETLHNMLQYGAQNIHFSLPQDSQTVQLFGDAYRMDPKHTGNLFTLYFCEEIGYTESVKTNGALQNKQASAIIPPSSTADTAHKALQDKGYTSTKDGADLKAALETLLVEAEIFAADASTITSTVDATLDEDGVTYAATIVYFATADDAAAAYATVKAYALENKVQSTDGWVFEKLGTMIYWGTKTATSDAN